MGQSFRVAAPRARRALAWRGKLGEILFDGSPAALEGLLAVPVRPPNPPENPPEAARSTDPPTPSRTDYRATEAPDGGSNKRKADGEVLASSSPRPKRAKTTSGDDTVDTSHRVTFLDLPCEMHRHIFTFIDDIEDIVSLGLANRYLWAIGREYMHDYYMSSLGPWAGKNIVCVGEDVEPDDYPPGLFSDKELESLRQETLDISDGDPSSDYETVPFTLHHFTSPRVSGLEEDFPLFFRSTGFDLLTHPKISKDAAFASIQSEIPFDEKTYFPRNQPWILRNLTTKQFVRSEAIALKPEFIHGPKIDLLGFGEVVMSRISWSSSSFVNMADTTNISRGVWAGHCFDITTLQRHKREETNHAAWRDVSDEIAGKVADIWESEFGPNWREIICRGLWWF